MTTAAAQSIPLAIWGRIRQVRSQLRFWILVDGLSRILGAVLLMVALDLVIDWSFHLDKAQRGIMLLLGIGALGWIAWKHLIRPLRTEVSDEAIVRQVEAQHGGLGESLISTLEFSQQDWSKRPDVSAMMVEQTIAAGTAQASEVDFGVVIRKRAHRRHLVLVGVLLLVMLGLVFGVAANPSLSTWFNRNVLLGNAQWPLSYYLELQGLEDGKLFIPRGDDWTIEALLSESSRSKPDEARLEIKTARNTRRESMDRMEKGKRYQRTVRNITESFDFRLVSGKFESPWAKVVLVDRPVVETIDLSAEAPAYAAVTNRVLSAEQSPYYLLKGTTLRVKGASNKMLSRATLAIGEKIFEMQVKDKTFFMTVPSDAVLPAKYEVNLYDTENIYQPEFGKAGPLTSFEPTRFTVRNKEDSNPAVTLKLNGIGNLVVPTARIPFSGTFKDDFLIKEAALVFRMRNDNEGTSSEGVHHPEGLSSPIDKASFKVKDALELPQLELTIGSSLTLFLEAEDNDTVSGPKIGESAKYLLRVVSEPEFRSDMLRREKEQRQTLQQIYKLEDELLTTSQTLIVTGRGKDELDRKQQDTLLRLQKKQKAQGLGIARVSGRLKDLLLEAQNNRIEDEDGRQRKRLTNQVIKPLDSLAHEVVPQVVGQLDQAWRKAEDAEARTIALSQATAGEQAILGSLKRILASMAKSAEFQEAVNLLYDIEKSEAELKRATDKAKEEAIDKVFEDVVGE